MSFNFNLKCKQRPERQKFYTDVQMSYSPPSTHGVSKCFTSLPSIRGVSKKLLLPYLLHMAFVKCVTSLPSIRSISKMSYSPAFYTWCIQIVWLPYPLYVVYSKKYYFPTFYTWCIQNVLLPYPLHMAYVKCISSYFCTWYIQNVLLPSLLYDVFKCVSSLPTTQGEWYRAHCPLLAYCGSQMSFGQNIHFAWYLK